MARTREPEIEFDPRHRIVGAIVLVTLAVILLPLILDEHPNHSFSAFDSTTPESSSQPEIVVSGSSKKPEKVIIKKITISSASGGDRNEHGTSKMPATENKNSGGSGQATSKSVQADAKTTSTPKKASTVNPVVKKTVAINTQKKQKPVVQAGWTVQVGTFSNQTNVRRLKQQLEQKGYSVLFKDITLKQGSAVRVRVGPYSSRALADKAQHKIRQDIGIKGVVVASP